jgi:hypothetical protein
MSIEVFNVSIEQETENEILRYNKFFQSLEGVNKYLNIKWNEWFLDEESSNNLEEMSVKSLENINSNSEKSSVCSSDVSDSDREDTWDIPDKELISIQTLKNIVCNNKINETRSAKILEYGEGNMAKYVIVIRLNKFIINE